MSERLSPRVVAKGTDAAKLHHWVIIFLVLGILGRSVLQNALLGVNNLTTDELLAAMEGDPTAMWILTGALVCKVLETCAAPLLAFLLVEGYQRTSSIEKYLIRILGLALISELPYNLAMEGSVLFLGSRNPVFALVIGLVMLYFFSRFQEKGIKSILVKLVIFAAAFLWCLMLRIDHGICLIIFIGVLWFARKKTGLRSLFGFCAAMASTLFNTYYLGACLSCIMLHRYNEEKGEQNRALNYGFYPACLLLVGVAAKFL